MTENNIELVPWRMSNSDSCKWHRRTIPRTQKTFAMFAQVTIPQITEGGEIWPKDTSDLMARTTIPVQQVTQAHPQIGMDAGECKNAQPADEKVIMQETAKPNRTMNSGTPDATGTTTATTHADWLHIDPSHPDTQVYTIHTLPHAQEMTILYHQWNHHFTTRPSPMPTNQGVGNLELSQMLQTILCENNEEAKLKQQQKNLMANIPTFDGKDKKACLMWVNHMEHTAKQARMTFREAVTSKAGPTVVTAISRYPNASDAQLKRINPRKLFQHRNRN